MIHGDQGGGDSPGSEAGLPTIPGPVIPGLADTAAFVLVEPQPTSLPVLIAVPHAGRAYPRSLTERMRHPGESKLRLEDRHADSLARAVAEATGAGLLIAQAPRAMIDLNRAPDDIDWEMFARDPAQRGPTATNGVKAAGFLRARTGLGLIPRRLPGLGDLWTRPHDRAELAMRIEAIHAPYHETLGRALGRLRARWGAALLIDLHSMPPLPLHHGAAAAEFVLGDRFGASCDGGLVAATFGFFAGEGRRIAHNRPYAGGYVLERHGTPAKGIHALQIEIDRASYLDARLDAPGAGFEPLAAMLARYVARMADATATLGRSKAAGNGLYDNGWAEAAE